MHDLVLLIVASFACYRLSELVTVDDGPFDVFKTARKLMGAYYLDEDGEPESNLGRLAICPYCTGIWFALLLALVIWQPLSIEALLTTLFYWLAIAGGQAFLQNVGGRV